MLDALAAGTGNSQFCELLIEEGAEVDEVDRAGETPVMTAVICDNREVKFLELCFPLTLMAPLV